MFDRLKRVLVESFIGAIALGYLFAIVILDFVNIFAAPVEGWSTRNILQGLGPRTAASSGSPLQAALPPMIAFVVLLLVWYILLRWLYFTPPKRDAPETAPDPQLAA